MKWQLITLGLGWGYFLFKLYQQYRQSKTLYSNPYIQKEKVSESSDKILFDSDSQPASTNPIITEQNIPNSANQVPKMEGNANIENFEPHKKPFITLDNTIDETDFVIFPELYPQLKKKKSISKRYLTKGGKEKNKLNLKRKRDSKKYKEWFITNKAIFQIKESGQFTQEQMQEHYEKLTREIKSTVLQSHQTGSESIRSEQGTEAEQTFTVKNSGEKLNKVLGFLDDEDQYESNSCKIVKYDPFE